MDTLSSKTIEYYEHALDAIGYNYQLTEADKARLFEISAKGFKIRTLNLSTWARSLTGKLVRVTRGINYPGLYLVPDEGALRDVLMTDLRNLEAYMMTEGTPKTAISMYTVNDEGMAKFHAFYTVS